MDLEKRWIALWPDAIPNRVAEAYAVLHAHYRGRPYHNLEHITQCLGQLDKVKVSFRSLAVEVALWYHDAIYDPKRKDNEEWSVDLAHKEMHELDAPYAFRHRVGELILATKHNKQVDDPEAQTIVDIDLHTLGGSAKEYEEYSKAIRQEYDWVPEADYIKGRVAVLKSFLDRPHIYYTDHFRQFYEQTARRNLAEEIRRLNQPQ